MVMTRKSQGSDQILMKPLVTDRSCLCTLCIYSKCCTIAGHEAVIRNKVLGDYRFKTAGFPS